jgi:alkylhydroperoxidase family enzyme
MKPPRVAPAPPPYPDDVQIWLDRTMPPGVPPLTLFATLARDPRLFGKFMSAGLLDRGNLTLRQREIVIDRVTARCGSAYEWGVHVALFGERARLTADEIASLATGDAGDPCWGDEERLLIRLCDALHASCEVDDVLWDALAARFSDTAMIELLMLAGFYRTVSYLTNALRLAPEQYAAPLPGRR